MKAFRLLVLMSLVVNMQNLYAFAIHWAVGHKMERCFKWNQTPFHVDPYHTMQTGGLLIKWVWANGPYPFTQKPSSLLPSRWTQTEVAPILEVEVLRDGPILCGVAGVQDLLTGRSSQRTGEPPSGCMMPFPGWRRETNRQTHRGRSLWNFCF